MYQVIEVATGKVIHECASETFCEYVRGVRNWPAAIRAADFVVRKI